MKLREIRWRLVLISVLCLLPAVWGGLWAFSGTEGTEALGLALMGFFGAGFFVLIKQALRP